MRTRRNILIYAGVVIGILLLALLLRQPVTQHFTLDGSNVMVESNYNLSGSHNGELVVMGNTIQLADGSQVAGNTSLIGKTVNVAGKLNGNLTALGEDVYLDPAAQIAGQASLMGTNVTIAGHLRGALTINSDTLRILPGTQIDGTINACAKQTDDRRIGAAKPACLDSDIKPFAGLLALRESGMHASLLTAQIDPLGMLVMVVFGTLTLTGMSVLLVTFFPRQISHIEEAMRARPRSLGGVGIAAYALAVGVLFALIVVLALLPPVGLLLVPVFILLTLLLFVLSMTGLVTLIVMVGDALLRRTSKLPTPPLIAAAVGSLILSLLLASIALLPFGFAISFVLLGLFSSVGLGASLFTRIGTRPVGRTYFIQG